MQGTALDIAGAYRFDLIKRGDNRGSFTRVFCADTLAEQANLNKPLKHINHSVSAHKGTVRGLRYQIAPALETKAVTCLRGRVFDVMVDLRRGSPSFMTCVVNEVSADNLATIFVPVGVAHGFQTLEGETHILYMTTEPYNKECERSVRYNDPALDIQWPLAVAEISDRDAAILDLPHDFLGIDV